MASGLAIEDANVTPTPGSRQVNAVNDYVTVDGENDIVFTVTWGGASYNFTLKPGETNTVPFSFERFAWKTNTGVSAFRCFAHT